MRRLLLNLTTGQYQIKIRILNKWVTLPCTVQKLTNGDKENHNALWKQAEEA